MKNLIIILLSGVLSQDVISQTTWFVNPAATGANTGTSWHDAFTNLHDALVGAQKGDAVWASEGIYTPSPNSDRNASFVLKSGVKFYGGFAGMETELVQRNPEAHATILSGDIGSPTDSTDNSYTILYLLYPDSSTLIDGFTFRHGYASSDTSFNFLSPVLCGGAVYVMAKNGVGLPVFNRCRFLDNYAKGSGGAYFVLASNTKGSTPVFRHCEFRNNRAGQKGGAIFVTGGNPYDRGVEFDHCMLTDNQVSSAQGQGGALYFQINFGNEEIQFKTCTIDRNFSVHSGGALSISYSNAEQVSFLIDSCQMNENRSISGPGIINFVQSLGAEVPTVNFTLINSEIINNTTNSSNGLIFLESFSNVDSDSFAFWGNKFIGNSSKGYLISASHGPIIKNNEFIENRSSLIRSDNVVHNWFLKNKGVCVYSGGLSADSLNIGIINNLFLLNGEDNAHSLYNSVITTTKYLPPNSQLPKTRITGNIFYNNRSFADSNPSNDPSTAILELRNNIFLGNINTATGEIGLPFQMLYDSTLLSFNLMDLPCPQLPSRVVCGPGNITTSDPMFMDTAAGNYRLHPCSPAIGAGSNAAALLAGILKDFDGQPRILDGAVDIGPYESPMIAETVAPEVTPACAGQAAGAVQFYLQNGCLPFTFSWNNGSQTGDNTDQLTAGAYFFTITDQKGKIFNTAVQVPGAELLSASATVQDASEPATADGSISFAVQSGTAPFTFLWSTGDTTPLLNGLLPGHYTLTVTDAAGCAYYYMYEVKFTSGTGQLQTEQPGVRPNPAGETVHIQFGEFQSWYLFSPEGRLCRTAEREGEFPLRSLELNGLPEGAYVFLFKDSQGRMKQGKLIILP